MKVPGFLYEVNGVIVFNRELKPEEYEYSGIGCYSILPVNTANILAFKAAVRKWTEACMPVDDVFQCGEHEFRIYLTKWNLSPCIKDAQPCLAELGEKAKIIELI